MSCGTGGRDSEHNIGVTLQMQIMERLWDMMSEARLENLRFPVAEDGR